MPNPLQAKHIPWGLLNENDWGVRAGKEIPQGVQARCSENIRSVSPICANKTPLPMRRVCSTLSVSRSLTPGLITSRSVMSSTVCFLRLSKVVISSNRWISPLTRRRTKPWARADSISSRCSPFRLTNSDCIRLTRVPSGDFSSSNTIFSAV